MNVSPVLLYNKIPFDLRLRDSTSGLTLIFKLNESIPFRITVGSILAERIGGDWAIELIVFNHIPNMVIRDVSRIFFMATFSTLI
jgi:hypothetical protein